MKEQEIEEMAKIVHKTLSFDIGPVNDADRDDARKILSLINETHIPLDKEVKIVCEHWRTDACKGCKYGDVITPTDIHCRVNGVITRTVGELVEGGK